MRIINSERIIKAVYVLIPVIYGEAPILSKLIHVVWRAAGSEVIPKKLGICPCIAGVFVHQDGDVSLYGNAKRCALRHRFGKLFVQSHLEPGVKQMICFSLRAVPSILYLSMGGGSHLVPLYPGCLTKSMLQVHKNRVFAYPGIFYDPVLQGRVFQD